MSVHSMEVTVAIIDERASFGIDTSGRVVRDAPAEAALPGGFSTHLPRGLFVDKSSTSEQVQTWTKKSWEEEFGVKIESFRDTDTDQGQGLCSFGVISMDLVKWFSDLVWIIKCNY